MAVLVTPLPVILGRRFRVFVPPEFEALAVVFAFGVAVGGLREVFEFAMNAIFSLDTQKEILGEPKGLTDTMGGPDREGGGSSGDRGAGLRLPADDRGDSFLERWIDRFVESDPRLFEAPLVKAGEAP